MKKYFILLVPIIIFVLIFVFYHSTKPKQVFPTTTNVSEPTVTNSPTIIQPDKYPDSYLINTFFITQAPEKNWLEPWQDACEEAAILTVKDYYFHLSPHLQQQISDLQAVFDFEKTNNFSEDINTTQMATVSAKLYGFKSIIIPNPNLDTFKKYLSENMPIIVPADGKILFTENSHFKSGGPWYHNLVVLGYDDHSQQFIVHDVGTQFGAYYRYSYSLLLSSIHDFPASGKKEDIATGPKNILVLIK